MTLNFLATSNATALGSAIAAIAMRIVAASIFRGLPPIRPLARGRKGGRPKGLSPSAIEKAIIAEALYKDGSIPVKKIATQLDISKTTLYLYLRHRNVCIGKNNTKNILKKGTSEIRP